MGHRPEREWPIQYVNFIEPPQEVAAPHPSPQSQTGLQIILIAMSICTFLYSYIYMYIYISSLLGSWALGPSGVSGASGVRALRKCSRSGFSHFRPKNLRSRSRFDLKHELSLEVWPVHCARARVSAIFAGRGPRNLWELRACGCF